MISSDDHIRLATAAAERRLAIASSVLFGDEEHDGPNDSEVDTSELMGPYCGCDTCIVREVLDAAWPHILAAGDEMIKENERLRADLRRAEVLYDQIQAALRQVRMSRLAEKSE